MLSGWFLFQNRTSTPDLFDRYYSLYPNLEMPLERGTDIVENPYYFYESGQYDKAIVALKDLDGLPARFYLGLCLVATVEYQDAIIAFQEVSQKSGKYQNPAKWYLALSFIKVERFGEAQPVLEDLKTTKDYGVRSITILNELFPESNP